MRAYGSGLGLGMNQDEQGVSAMFRVRDVGQSMAETQPRK